MGMATKEVMVTAPLVVVLFDYTFLPGSFRDILRRRWGLYLGLAATWSLSAYLVYKTGLIGERDAVRAYGVMEYAQTQPGVILYYLRLAVWPRPLCLDYGWQPAVVVPAVVAVAVLGCLILWGLIRRQAWAFLGAAFFLILAPSSSFMPLGQIAFEHRVYLSLAAVVTLIVAGGYWIGRRFVDRGLLAAPTMRLAGVGAIVAVGVVLAVLTYERNRDYQSSLAIWQDTVAKAPLSYIAWDNLGSVLQQGEYDKDRIDEAIRCHRKALDIRKGNPMALFGLGAALAKQKRLDEAIACYEEALSVSPQFATAHNNLGAAFELQGKLDKAEEHYREAVRINLEFASAHQNFARMLQHKGKVNEALGHYLAAAILDPANADLRYDFGSLLLDSGRTDEAIEQLRESLRLKPDNPQTLNALAIARLDKGQTDAALTCWRKALTIQPDCEQARYNLAKALAELESAGTESTGRERGSEDRTQETRN